MVRPNDVVRGDESSAARGSSEHEAQSDLARPATLPAREVPVRYQIKEDERGRFLVCRDAPNIAVRIERGLTVSAAAARKVPECTIFVDGVVAAGPFMDVQRRVYNLDHHEGCIRAFSLAACEQAAVVVRKGLDLAGESWTVIANEPDLDAALAIWVLVNHLRLGDERRVVWRRVMPLVRLQGVIDAHGFELRDLTAFPHDLQLQTQAAIDGLRRTEVQLKEAGRWGQTDPLEHTVAVLAAIDELVYTADDLGAHRDVDEMDRSPLVGDKIVLACRSELGIYELEEHLKLLHGDRIGIIVLAKRDGTYTLRQVDPFLPQGLEPVYDRLNQLDAAVRRGAVWGGASDIGGSPRGRPSALSGQEIVDACTWVYRQPSPGQRMAVVAAATLAPAALLWCLLAAVTRALPGGPGAGWLAATTSFELAAFSLLLAALAGGGLVAVARAHPGRFGLRLPAGWGWLLLLPVVVLAAIGGGAWMPAWLIAPVRAPDGLGWAFLAVVACGVVGVELLFRGLGFGVLMTVFNVQHPGGRSYLSVPTGVTAAAQALAAALLLAPPGWLDVTVSPLAAAAHFAAPFLLGLACGAARERAASLAAPIALHLVAAVTVWLLAPLFW